MKSIITPVTLQSLEKLGTLYGETLLVLLRFYEDVDLKVPAKFRDILLGQRDFYFSHKARNIIEDIVASVLNFPKSERCHFMIVYKDKLCLTESAKVALKEYVEKHSPLNSAVYMTNKEWLKSSIYKNRYGNWSNSGFW